MTSHAESADQTPETLDSEHAARSAVGSESGRGEAPAAAIPSDGPAPQDAPPASVTPVSLAGGAPRRKPPQTCEACGRIGTRGFVTVRFAGVDHTRCSSNAQCHSRRETQSDAPPVPEVPTDAPLADPTMQQCDACGRVARTGFIGYSDHRPSVRCGNLMACFRRRCPTNNASHALVGVRDTAATRWIVTCRCGWSNERWPAPTAAQAYGKHRDHALAAPPHIFSIT